ncbi:MAG TPA: vitamin B12-dependent ribonucleotide reductase [Polyangia bacterium]
MIEKPEARKGRTAGRGKTAVVVVGRSKRHPGLRIPRFFSNPDTPPFDQVEWELRTASITGEKGKVYFEQKDIEVPRAWSQTATNVVAQKYFRGVLGSPAREKSVRQLLARVAATLARWGEEDGYFASAEEGRVFHDELCHLLVHQKMSFNSPVWFNVGLEEHPQCSACFINSVEDSMESILTLAKTEGMLFKWGSGTGTNFSSLRSSKEALAGGGTASGPVSFMKGFDAFAGVIKSGGKTRRAAKMVILNADHPDILEFVNCKSGEERKAWALIEAGYDSSFNGEAYASVFFQNSNNSVRVSDEFMEAVSRDGDWHTRSITTGQVVETFRARKLFNTISGAAHQCGDPGMQFDTTINAWHTCPNSGRINASNPCSEFMFVDDSACNLASLNLMRFVDDNGEFDVESFRHAVEITILAQEIMVGRAKYPTERITENSQTYRPLGLGYANLGALLMARGLPYDSEPGRAYAAAITSIMTGHAYAMSARVSRDVTGPFDAYEQNRDPMLGVLEKHRRYVDRIDAAYVPYDLISAARSAWDEALTVGREHGFRNAQVSVLAPTGTIGFMMDCDTTGVEPPIALVAYKKLVGGGIIKIVSQTVPMALARLGYPVSQAKKICDYIEEAETIEGAPGLKEEHLPVFDCAFRSPHGLRCIHYLGHVRMMAAVQPFLSGAISKTVNLPCDATVGDIEDAFLQAWKLGLKAIAVYRDGCKLAQPLSTKKQGEAEEKQPKRLGGPPAAVRRKLPDERHSLTHKFSVGGHEGYLHVGLYEDGSPGEIFIRMAKEGSTIAGLMDSFATAISISLQHGVPLKLLTDKFAHTRFDPAGFTGNPEVPRATSLMDYIFRWLALKFVDVQKATGAELSTEEAAAAAREMKTAAQIAGVVVAQAAKLEQVVGKANGNGTNGNGRTKPAVPRAGFLVEESDAPACHECGSIMVRSGACHKCQNCGATSGCS